MDHQSLSFFERADNIPGDFLAFLKLMSTLPGCVHYTPFSRARLPSALTLYSSSPDRLPQTFGNLALARRVVPPIDREPPVHSPAGDRDLPRQYAPRMLLSSVVPLDVRQDRVEPQFPRDLGIVLHVPRYHLVDFRDPFRRAQRQQGYGYLGYLAPARRCLRYGKPEGRRLVLESTQSGLARVEVGRFRPERALLGADRFGEGGDDGAGGGYDAGGFGGGHAFEDRDGPTRREDDLGVARRVVSDEEVVHVGFEIRPPLLPFLGGFGGGDRHDDDGGGGGGGGGGRFRGARGGRGGRMLRSVEM